jgi:hypothetical protein
MNKYLEKIAADEKKKKTNWHPGAAVGAAFVGNLVGKTPFEAARMPLLHKVIKKVNAPSDSGADLHTVRKYMKDTGLHKTTTFNTRKHNIDNASFKGKLGEHFRDHLKANPNANGPAYLHGKSFGAKKNFIIGKGFGNGKVNPDVIMHELGHAKDYQHLGRLKMGLKAVAATGGSAGALAALTNDKTRDYAPALAALPGLATLRDEGAANYHAYHGIKAHKGAAAANKFVRKLLPAQMGSYALSAVAPVAGTYVAKKILDHFHPKDKK